MTSNHALRIVVMGVSGCGKTTVGRALAQALDLDYVEGDDLHPPRNVALMAAGTPLTDADRQGWLQSVASVLADQSGRQGRGVVVTCSALKRSYRDLLRASAPDLRLVHLHGSFELLSERMAARSGHYMPVSLLQSQLDTLQWPGPEEAAVVVDVSRSQQDIVRDVLRALNLPAVA